MRTAEISRKTGETDIYCKINLDGKGESVIDTGVGFFDHMLTAFSKHGIIDLELKCKGDLIVDCHHTVEDCGIVLGECIKEALSDKKGINRYGDAIVPLDEALILTAIDLSGRAYFSFDAKFNTERVGYFDTEMTKEFFYALCDNSKMNLHIKEISGENSHHIIEAMFKSFAVAFRKAIAYNERITGTPSTKGVL